jgi:hypothetical protein
MSGKIFVLLVILISLLAGCLPIPGKSSHQKFETVQIVPFVSDNPSKSHIFLLRPDQRYLRSRSVIAFENSQKIGVVEPGSFLAWDTEPGKKMLYTKKGKLKSCSYWDKDCINSKDSTLNVDPRRLNYNSNVIEFNAKKGISYYIVIEIEWVAKFNLAILSLNDALRLVFERYKQENQEPLLSLIKSGQKGHQDNIQ